MEWSVIGILLDFMLPAYSGVCRGFPDRCVANFSRMESDFLSATPTFLSFRLFGVALVKFWCGTGKFRCGTKKI